jgi:3(or 17)beta-hydroxysteroid dehydrogenase
MTVLFLASRERPEMARVDGKVALVTGAAQGLGLAIARKLAAEGAHVMLTDLSADRGAAAAEAIGPAARFRQQDVTDEADWPAAVAEAAAWGGGLDILVNNAGVVALADPEATTLDQFRALNRVMSEGVFLGCRAALPALARSGHGAIVNMSSIASRLGYPVFFAYSAAKGAVAAMTRSLAVHCQDRGYPVRVNSVHPGAIETPMVMGAQGRDSLEEVPPGVLPAGALGHPDDVAGLVCWLASAEARFVTGQEFVIDNGLSVRA